MLRLRIGSSQIGTYSIGGIQGLPNTALVKLRTTSTDMMPSQNDGVAMPPTAKTRTTMSIQVFCLSADIVPSGMAMAMAMTVARMAISREIGSLRQDFGRDRHARPHRGAEIQPHASPDEIDELDDDRPIHAELGMAQRDGLGVERAAARSQAHDADVARDQPHQHEHQRGRSQQGRDHEQHALDDVASTSTCRARCSPGPGSGSGSARSSSPSRRTASARCGTSRSPSADAPRR